MSVEKHGTGIHMTGYTESGHEGAAESTPKRCALDDLTPEQWAAAEDAVDRRKAARSGSYNDPITHPTDPFSGRPW